jgi:hypothetical protein
VTATLQERLHQGRLESYAELRGWGLTRRQAATRLGVTPRTAERYEAALRAACPVTTIPEEDTVSFPPPAQPDPGVPFINWRRATPYEAQVVIPAAWRDALAADVAVLTGVLTVDAVAAEVAA